MAGLLIAIIVCYVTLIMMDIFFPGLYWVSNAVKFGGVFLCFALSLVNAASRPSNRDSRLLALALFFTVGADALLLFTGMYPLGVAVFCCAHLTYLRRYGCRLPSWQVAAIAVAALLLGVMGWLAAVAAVYAVLICSVLIRVFRAGLPSRTARLARAGMVLFLLCDIHVLAYRMLPAGHFYSRTALALIWVFYLPSQALIAMSGEGKRRGLAH